MALPHVYRSIAWVGL